MLRFCSSHQLQCMQVVGTQGQIFLKGRYFKMYCSQQELGSYSSLKGTKAFSTSQKSHCGFFLLFSLMFCFLVQKKMTGTLETPISLQKLKREDTTKYVLGDEYGHCREPLENVQNTGKKKQFFWNVHSFASVSHRRGEPPSPF